ncbi:hypothetical protein GCM10020295_58930 [Streptomyces cinereospinus]
MPRRGQERVLGLLAQGEGGRQDREPLAGRLPLGPPLFVVGLLALPRQWLARARETGEVTARLRVPDLLTDPDRLTKW